MVNLAHIDGDIVAYRSAAACEKAHYKLTFEKDGTVHNMMFENAAECAKFVKANKIESFVRDTVKELESVELVYYNIRTTMENILDKLQPDEGYVYLTGSNNFRKLVDPLYKANRDPADRPTHLEAARNYLIQEYGAIMCNGYEADDGIGINYKENMGTVVSIDKDLKQIPGQHYDWVKDEALIVNFDEANLNFWRQMLIGDKTDNVFGIKGIGPVKAAKIVTPDMDLEERMDAVIKLYDNNKLDFGANYKLLRILRSEQEYASVKEWLKTRQVPAE
jgi:5'-3' exonuclease